MCICPQYARSKYHSQLAETGEFLKKILDLTADVFEGGKNCFAAKTRDVFTVVYRFQDDLFLFCLVFFQREIDTNSNLRLRRPPQLS